MQRASNQEIGLRWSVQSPNGFRVWFGTGINDMRFRNTAVHRKNDNNNLGNFVGVVCGIMTVRMPVMSLMTLAVVMAVTMVGVCLRHVCVPDFLRSLLLTRKVDMRRTIAAMRNAQD